MTAARAAGGAGAALLAVWALSAAGADAPKPTPAPAVASKPVALPRAAVLTKRKTTVGFESTELAGLVGHYMDTQVGCAVEGNEDQSIKKCTLDVALDGTKFAACEVSAIIDFTPGVHRCGFVVPKWPHGKHVLSVRVPDGPQLAASPPASVPFDVQRTPTHLTYSFVLGGSGAFLTFHLNEKAKSQGVWVVSSPLGGRTISVKANGLVKGTTQTDAMGHATFTLSAGGHLSQLMEAVYEGDLTYEPVTSAPHQFHFAL